MNFVKALTPSAAVAGNTSFKRGGGGVSTYCTYEFSVIPPPFFLTYLELTFPYNDIVFLHKFSVY